LVSSAAREADGNGSRRFERRGYERIDPREERQRVEGETFACVEIGHRVRAFIEDEYG
jgi:hypothetical protein